MQSFVYTGLPTRVVFGDGTLVQVAQEAARLGITRALVLSTPQQEDMARQVAGLLGDAAVGVFAEAAMHTPVEVTQRAMRVVQETRANGVVAIGGGSTTGLGKAIALRTDLPQLVLPTTYAGSEMTPILGQTEGRQKTTLRDLKVLPETVIYDAGCTLAGGTGLPPVPMAGSDAQLLLEDSGSISMMISTRRLAARPSAVSFEAIGRVSA